jgi:hypothetical protein
MLLAMAILIIMRIIEDYNCVDISYQLVKVGEEKEVSE